jgi:hypothetical protein
MMPWSRFGKWAACAAIGSALAFVPVAQAGLKSSIPVSISFNQAYGSAGSARNSVDSKQRIDCQFSGTTTGVGVYCFAEDVNGTVKACSSADPSFVAAATKFQPDSLILFNFDPITAACTQLQVLTASQEEPKRP